MADFTKSSSIVKSIGSQSVKQAIEINETNLDDLITDYNTNVTKNDATNVKAKSWVVDEDDLTSDLDTKVPTQQSVKAYIDAQIAALVLTQPGTIRIWGGAIADIPAGNVLCDGAAYSRTVTYDDLFEAIGTIHGVGDGSTTFNVPDLTDKFVIHADADSGGTNYVGEDLDGEGSTEGHLLTTDELPEHTHPYAAGGTGGSGGAGQDSDATTASGYSTEVNNTDEDAHTHDISDYKPKAYALAYIIKY